MNDKPVEVPKKNKKRIKTSRSTKTIYNTMYKKPMGPVKPVAVPQPMNDKPVEVPK
jgi:hypothetical protein